ncbi:MAG: hypothetical protein IPL40_15745 [Proteobacteria bacterium]|nr:hypothetical protein [Pseudomonadota bacterium]
MPLKEKIRVCWSDVETACERNAPGLHSYLDRQSGAVLVVVDGAPEDEATRRRIAAGAEGFLQLQPASSRTQYEWMDAFVATVADQALRDQLLIATDGRGAFRRFKDALLDHPAERERWFAWRGALLHAHIRAWFAEQRLEPDPPCPWDDDPPPLPPPALRDAGPRRAATVSELRQGLAALVEILPSAELHAARVFLEYLRDRGSAELDGARGRLDPRRPFRRRAPQAARGLPDPSVAEDLGADDPTGAGATGG